MTNNVIDLSRYKEARASSAQNAEELRALINNAPGIDYATAVRFAGDLDGLERYLKQQALLMRAPDSE